MNTKQPGFIVRINSGTSYRGTGVRVAPGRFVTCGHVVTNRPNDYESEREDGSLTGASCLHLGESPAQVSAFHSDLDLALVETTEPGGGECVQFVGNITPALARAIPIARTRIAGFGEPGGTFMNAWPGAGRGPHGSEHHAEHEQISLGVTEGLSGSPWLLPDLHDELCLGLVVRGGRSRPSSNLLYADGILAFLRRNDIEPRVTEASKVIRFRPRTHREALGAALELDRAEQWWGILEHCRTEREDAYFLLYGTAHQNLRLFVDRVFHHLPTRAPNALHTIRLRYERGGSRPQTAGEWLHRIQAPLGRRLGQRELDAEALMTLATQERDLLMVVDISRTQPFEAEHQSALRGFLVDRLPTVVPEKARCRTRVVVSTDYEAGDESPYWQAIRDFMSEAGRATRFQFVDLPEVKLPDRDDVAHFLTRNGLEPGQRMWRTVMTDFETLVLDAKSRISFEEVAEILDQSLDSGDEGCN